MTRKHISKRTSLGSVLIGDSFVFRTAEILGLESGIDKLPPFEGQALTVVGFNPRYKNNVVVRDPYGRNSLMPLEMVEKGLSSVRDRRVQ
jgi:hypothetical protein